LLEYLREMGALRNFAVDPMASDLTSWTPDDYGVFVRLMRISRKELIEHHSSLVNRTAYFEEISHPGDLFLDPDTGIATGRVNDRRCYVFPQEIGRLLDAPTGRLLAIYQHVRAKRVTDRLNEVLGTLERLIGSFSWCSYESGNVAMLFLSRDPARSQRVADCFKTVLGRHAAARIRSSTAPAQ
jgi:hypothetical protein